MIAIEWSKDSSHTFSIAKPHYTSSQQRIPEADKQTSFILKGDTGMFRSSRTVSCGGGERIESTTRAELYTGATQPTHKNAYISAGTGNQHIEQSRFTSEKLARYFRRADRINHKSPQKKLSDMLLGV